MDLLAKHLRRRAEELGISHADAARRSGLSERRYSHYVTGIREPDLATLVRISRALQTSPNHLLGVDEQPKPTGRARALDRILSALQALSDPEFELLLTQIEAVANKRTKARKKKS
jgi:transcriptional regulator with XRE-family HTH domain